MSSWKKAAKANQKTHRERHQPASRAHLGLLEKKKDYAERAADYDEKGRTLRLLRRRVLDKNPDEFYHHMINSKIQDGEHHELAKEDENTPEQVKLLQTQDIKYINMKRTQESRRIARLQSGLHLTAAPPTNKHTLFMEREQFRDGPPEHPALLRRTTNTLTLDQMQQLALPALTPQKIGELKKARDRSYRELSKRIDREKELTVVQQKMELKRHLRDVGLMKPKKVKRGTAVSAPVYRFQYQRKR